MEQKEILEAGALAIRSIGVIEQAYHLIDEEIQTKVGMEVETAVQDQLSDKNWTSKMLSDEHEFNDGSWVAPNSWKNQEEDDWFAWFYIWSQYPEKNNDAWCLTQMCGQGEAKVGFKWEAHYKLLGMKKTPWKKYAALQVEEHPKLEELGFTYNENEGSWFFPTLIEYDKLADAWANDEISEVLTEMVAKCLVNIFEAIPEFDAIIKNAQEISD